jgi:RNA polymerase sigma factor (sigma-70 family)
MDHEIGRREGMAGQQVLVTRARTGDQAAFATLIECYQAMALGYALSILGDYQLAQDATQEALLAAYHGLPSLEDDARFPAWLRGIVRFQCGRVRRKRPLIPASLDDAWDMQSDTLGPEQQLEVKEGFHRVLAAIRSLPAPQREVAMLFYVKDYSHREIATFLEMPATTVNNRLHAARKALRVRLLMNEKHGQVVAVHDVLVDVRFAAEDTPVILSGLTLSAAGADRGPILQVVQRVGDGLVRCVARGDLAGIAPGASILHSAEPLLTPLDADLLVRIVPLLLTLGEPDRGSAPQAGGDRTVTLETGIKAIDLLCPITRGGTVGILGPNGTGRMVISAEVLRNIARHRAGVTILAFLNGELEGRGLYDDPGEAPRPEGNDRIIFLPIDNSIDMSSPAVLAVSPLLDARIFLSFTLARQGIWPAIDPLLSTSCRMDPTQIGGEHYDTARAVRDLLRRERDVLEGTPEGKSRDLTAEERGLIARARKARRFISQPFAVAAPFTGRPGHIVPLAETLRAYKAILAGQYDDVPEETFMWRGGLDIAPDAAQ